MTTVRAKFKVQSVTESEGGHKTANLAPVTNGTSPENKEFFKWTPSGQISLGTINPKAAEQFVPGREFYVDFTPADEKPETDAQGDAVPPGWYNRRAGESDATYKARTGREPRAGVVTEDPTLQTR